MYITKRAITEIEVAEYIKCFIKRFEFWDDYTGPRIRAKDEYYAEEEAASIIKKLKRAKKSDLARLMHEYKLIPDQLFIFKDLKSKSETSPIYTGIVAESPHRDCALLEAFWGNEIHLLNNFGEVLYEEHYNYLTLGANEDYSLLKITLNDDYDTQVKGHASRYECDIIAYNKIIDTQRAIEFDSESGSRYLLLHEKERSLGAAYFSKQIIKGTGNKIIRTNLKLGYNYLYKLSGLSDADHQKQKTIDDFILSKSELITEKFIGESFETITDFTLNEYYFPSVNVSPMKLVSHTELEKEDRKSDFLKQYTLSPQSLSKTDAMSILLSVNDYITKLEGSKPYDFDWELASVFPYLKLELKTDLDIQLALFLRILKCCEGDLKENYSGERWISFPLPHTQRDSEELIAIIKHRINNLPNSVAELSGLINANDKGIEILRFRIPFFISEHVTRVYDELINIHFIDFVHKNVERAKEIVFLYPDLLYYPKAVFNDHKEILLAAVMIRGKSLEYASNRLKDDRDVVLAAIANEKTAIEFASERLKVSINS